MDAFETGRDKELVRSANWSNECAVVWVICITFVYLYFVEVDVIIGSNNMCGKFCQEYHCIIKDE